MMLLSSFPELELLLSSPSNSSVPITIGPYRRLMPGSFAPGIFAMIIDPGLKVSNLPQWLSKIVMNVAFLCEQPVRRLFNLDNHIFVIQSFYDEIRDVITPEFRLAVNLRRKRIN
jgi:hypothetical protein